MLFQRVDGHAFPWHAKLVESGIRLKEAKKKNKSHQLRISRNIHLCQNCKLCFPSNSPTDSLIAQYTRGNKSLHADNPDKTLRNEINFFQSSAIYVLAVEIARASANDVDEKIEFSN